MINLLLSYTVTTSAACLIMLILHKVLLKHLGAKTLYSLWLIIPLTALLILSSPFIAPSIISVVSQLGISKTSNLITIFNVTNSSQAQLVSSTTQIHSTVIGVWLTGTLSMCAVLAAEAIALKRQQSANLGHLNLQRNQHIRTPGVFGLLSPTIQFPKRFYARYSATERHLILRHEMMHWRRGDTHINLFAWLLLSTQWFNPLMWLSYRRFRADQELACDADVLATEFSNSPSLTASSYAEALLKTTINPSSNRGRGSIPLSPCSTHYGYQQGSFTMMKERLTHLNQRHKIRRYPTIICSVLACSFAVLWQLPAYSQASSESSAEENKPLAPIVRIEPRYPKEAVEKGIEGHVDLSFVITNDGKTANIEVLDSQPAGVFEEVVVAAVERWRYAPRDNKHTRIRVQMTMNNN